MLYQWPGRIVMQYMLIMDTAQIAGKNIEIASNAGYPIIKTLSYQLPILP